MSTSIASQFALYFHEASGQPALIYCDFIRFVAVTSVVLSVMWALHHFLSSEAKESDGFMYRLGSRLVRLSIGLTLFILFLTTSGVKP